MRTFELNTGRRIPVIGFGTWMIVPDTKAQRVVGKAIETGYRLIDTARIYGNERGVGLAVKESGIPRKNLFIASKVWNDDQGYDRTLLAFDESLDRLGLDYLDQYIIHWPATSRRHDSWRALEKLYKDGRVKAVGVGNYTIRHLKDLMERSSLIPAVNQVEFHPFIYQQQIKLLDYCSEYGIQIEAYSPLNRISGEKHAPVLQLAERYKRTPQQIVLHWCIQHGALPLVRSANLKHIISDLDIDNFKLSNEDMNLMDSLSDGERVTWDPGDMG
jgi:methylglyoxal/glyoxal reductase